MRQLGSDWRNKVCNTARFGVAFLMLLATAGAGCHGSSSPSNVVAPSSTPTPPPLTPTPMGVSGYVSDSAYRPLRGARIEALDGPQAGTSATTDANGQFTMAGQFDGTSRFSASLDGYIGAVATATQCASCVRAWVSFVLALPTPPISVAGDYTVTFIADPNCAGIPAELQTRSYAATMVPRAPSPNVPPDTAFRLTLNEGTFLPDYNNLWVGVAGNVVTMWFGGDGPYVVEQVASNTYIGFDGGIETVAAGSLQTIATSFTGFVDYCALNAPMGNYYNCPLSAVARSECQSANHQFRLTKR